MRQRSTFLLSVLLLVLIGTIAWADQIVLKDGTVYSGKFIRGDSSSVDFRVLGRVENFRISDIERIVFKEPELETSSGIRPASRVPDEAVAAPSIAERAQPAISAGEATPVQEPPAVPEIKEAPPAEPQPAVESRRSLPPLAPGSAVTLPVGTAVMIRTSTDIDTDRNRVGDVFEATLDQPVVYGDQMVFPRGTPVKGRIAYAKESGKLSGQAQLILELTDLLANGKSYILRTSDYTESGSNRANRTAATVGGGAALGAIIGAIAGGGTGAAVGAASGAAVGTGVQVLTKGQVLKIPAETILEFRLQSPLEVTAP